MAEMLTDTVSELGEVAETQAMARPSLSAAVTAVELNPTITI